MSALPRHLFLLLAIAALALCAGCKSDALDEDTFVVILDASPEGLDPRFATSDASAKLIGLLHAGLVTTDTEDGDLELDLAEKIEQPSERRYEITLRDDAYFHDGEPVTSEDVEYTFMQLGSDQVASPLSGTAERIEDFEVVDERRMVITLEEPYAPFMSDLALGIVPRHRCEGHSECRGEPIGAGPFEFVERDGDELYVFERADRHHREAPHLDRIAFKVVEDDNTRLLALLGDAADLVQNAVAPMLFPVVDGDDDLKMETTPSFKYTYLAFNLEHPILKERKVRQAIAHAIDRKAIIDYKFDGHARQSTGLLAPDHWAYEEDVPTYDYNVERARKLLDEAGYPKPEGSQPRFELEFKVSANNFRRSLAQLIGHQLGRVGIDVEVRSYEWGTLYDDIQSRNFAVTTMQWPSVLEPSLYTWIFHSDNIPSAESRSSGANRGAYKNEELDELLEAGEEETDRTKRKEIYAQVQKILARDLPYVSLWHEDNVVITPTDVEDYFMTPNARFEGLTEARRVDEDRGAK